MQWFESWFNTPYYHQLYRNRNEQEAHVFLHKLIPHLSNDKKSKFLDICCGKGRHSLVINELGFEVIGYDLSENSIVEAKKLENNNLHFYVHDMRKQFYSNYFDFALNLFTSFGYFSNKRDNINALKSANISLKKNGILVIDFMNSIKTRKGIVCEETKIIDAIEFKLNKKIENNRVVKEIQFEKEGQKFNYAEKVELLELADFKELLKEAGFAIKEVFGNYQLEPFNEESDRLIILAAKL
jgi:SAM-dependent methyltransferase